MAMMYCNFCDRYIDTDDEDHAEYMPVTKCSACVDAAAEEQELQHGWWQIIDEDTQWIFNNG